MFLARILFTVFMVEGYNQNLLKLKLWLNVMITWKSITCSTSSFVSAIKKIGVGWITSCLLVLYSCGKVKANVHCFDFDLQLTLRVACLVLSVIQCILPFSLFRVIGSHPCWGCSNFSFLCLVHCALASRLLHLLWSFFLFPCVKLTFLCQNYFSFYFAVIGFSAS